MKSVWLDADPGFDDIATWLMLQACPSVDLLGVSVVAGNAPLDVTLTNAVRARTFFQLPQRVYPGRSQPLTGKLVTSQYLLGKNGMASVGRTLPEGPYQGEPSSGPLALVDTARRHPGALTVVATGPLSNLAMAMMLEPDLPHLLEQVVWMGGSADRGNHTAAAEFNAFADPEAADLVLTSGVKFVLVGLNVTRQVLVTPAHLSLIRSWRTERANLFADHLEFYLGIRTPGTLGPMPFHDPVTALWLACPAAFAALPAGVRLELTGVLTRGMTVCEFRVPARSAANALVVMDAHQNQWEPVMLHLLKQMLCR